MNFPWFLRSSKIMSKCSHGLWNFSFTLMCFWKLIIKKDPCHFWVFLDHYFPWCLLYFDRFWAHCCLFIAAYLTAHALNEKSPRRFIQNSCQRWFWCVFWRKTCKFRSVTFEFPFKRTAKCWLSAMFQSGSSSWRWQCFVFRKKWKVYQRRKVQRLMETKKYRYSLIFRWTSE